MRLLRSSLQLFFALTTLFLFSASAQNATSASSVVRDENGLALLAQVINANGGNSVTGIHDFSASATITYHYSSTHSVDTPATLKSRGLSQFLLDAAVDGESRSWAINNVKGLAHGLHGTTTAIPYRNAITRGAQTLPIIKLNAAFSDPTCTIHYRDTTLNGQPVHELTLEPSLSAKQDPSGQLSAFQKATYYIDPQTLTVISVHDTIYSANDQRHSFDHATSFSDYRPVNGALVPFQIEDSVAGQKMWSLQLDSIAFNVGLTDADFVIQ